MKTFISKSKKKNRYLLVFFVLSLFLFIPVFNSAQPAYTFSYSTGNTYTPLTTDSIPLIVGDLSVPTVDEGLSAAIPIGFTFVYNFKPYTKFKVSANGFVTLDENLPWTRAYSFNSLESESKKLILAALWDDFYINPDGNIRYELTGQAGSRVLKIEFNDLTFFPGGVYAHLIYQVWLYEGTNIIEFRYGGINNEMGNWGANSDGISIGINDERDTSFMSITPGVVPSFSFSTSNDAILSHTYIFNGLVYKFTPVIRWQGDTNTDWLTKTNWELDTIPSAFDHALIPTGKLKYPILNNSGANCNDLTVESGASLTVSGGGELTVKGNLNNSGTIKVTSASQASTGSLIVKGTSSGTVSFERYLSGSTNWHLVSTPVTGHNIWAWATTVENNVATKDSKYAITTYNEGIDDWNSYPGMDTVGSFLTGKGYSTLRQTDGVVTFSGTIVTTDKNDIPIQRANKGWNLIGNPYTSAIGATSSASSTEYLLSTANVNDNLDPNYAGLYLWDPAAGASGDYVIINNSGGTPVGTLAQNYIQAGQGFFVRAKDNNNRNFDITRAMQVHQSGVPLKSGNMAWPTINLTAESGTAKSTTQISFNSEMTRGLDVTYDAGIFKKNPELSFYSKLVNDNGIGFAIQCLPEEYESLIIPVVVEVQTGREVVFSAELFNLPEDCQPFLEDRIAGKFTSLKSGNKYSIVINEKYKAQDALFVHTSNKSVTQSKIVENKEPFEIEVNRSEGFIKISSNLTEPATARITDVSGRIVAIKEINNGNNNLIRISGKTGIYVVQIRSAKYNFSKKLFWNN